MVSFEMNDMKKIGLGLTGFGVFFSFLGIIFLFDKGFLAMGNALFVNLTKAIYPVPDSFHIRTDDDNWPEIHNAVLHEAQELQGYNIIWDWLFNGAYRLASDWHDFGGLRSMFESDVFFFHVLQLVTRYRGRRGRVPVFDPLVESLELFINVSRATAHRHFCVSSLDNSDSQQLISPEKQDKRRPKLVDSKKHQELPLPPIPFPDIHHRSKKQRRCAHRPDRSPSNRTLEPKPRILLTDSPTARKLIISSSQCSSMISLSSSTFFSNFSLQLQNTASLSNFSWRSCGNICGLVKSGVKRTRGRGNGEGLCILSIEPCPIVLCFSSEKRSWLFLVKNFAL
ncbi:Got1/Sft2-like vescicle transport protein family isoform 4 [Carex littledalei]|uniref:Got1/Sft2-like vescicle transport protein family isoform 4 n=1 Tax=Carex littledalei TaxID=544730 RepID=A0A833QIG8_9POAL|nr:Got1/Sft2-like vescicle transport protein family isoform 4 [Carex littledalei]